MKVFTKMWKEGLKLEEYVRISLERYDNFLEDSRKANLLYGVKKKLIEIVDDEKFDLDKDIHSKIFKIYEKLCNEI